MGRTPDELAAEIARLDQQVEALKVGGVVSEQFERLGGYGRVSREIEQSMESDAVARWAKKRPADARGATPPSNGLGHDPVPNEVRSGEGPQHEYSQREFGLVKLENEVLRDLLEVCWTAITTLAPTGQNNAADGLRDRIWAHLHNEEAECPRCDHYIVNHEAAGPCACEGCECQSN
jgi:hypothetical protein